MDMSALQSLDEVGRRESVRVESLRSPSAWEVAELASVGIMEGARVRVLQKGWRQILVVSGAHEVALDRETARLILVSEEPEPQLEIV